jgi:hypothetical protein
MKCLYYLSPNLDISKQVSDDLHEAGQLDWYIHVLSRDEIGLAQKHIHSSNYLETLDLFRGTAIGGLIGFVLSFLAVMFVLYIDYFGQAVPNWAYFVFIIFITMFGIWEGGLYGIDSENQKIKPFHDYITNDKYLILVYIDKTQEATITKMMNEKHPESKLVGIDRHFINPFSKVKLV